MNMVKQKFDNDDDGIFRHSESKSSGLCFGLTLFLCSGFDHFSVQHHVFQNMRACQVAVA